MRHQKHYMIIKARQKMHLYIAYALCIFRYLVHIFFFVHINMQNEKKNEKKQIFDDATTANRLFPLNIDEIGRWNDFTKQYTTRVRLLWLKYMFSLLRLLYFTRWFNGWKCCIAKRSPKSVYLAPKSYFSTGFCASNVNTALHMSSFAQMFRPQEKQSHGAFLARMVKEFPRPSWHS